MIIERTDKEVIIRLPSTFDTEGLQDFINYLFYKQKKSDTIETHFASEEVLAKEWSTPEEDEAWKDL